MANDLNTKLREWARTGWQSVKTPGGHWKLTHPNCPQPIYTGSTPSDYRAMRNIEAQLRRALPPAPVPKLLQDAVRPKKLSLPPKRADRPYFDMHKKPSFSGPRLPGPGQWAQEAPEPEDHRERLVAWALCILRLRANRFGWDDIQKQKRRFKTEAGFRQDTIAALHRVTVAEVDRLVQRRQAFHEGKPDPHPTLITAVQAPVEALSPQRDSGAPTEPAPRPAAPPAAVTPTAATTPKSLPLAVVQPDPRAPSNGFPRIHDRPAPSEQPILGDEYFQLAAMIVEGHAASGRTHRIGRPWRC